jgi:hypothetical protein
VLLPLQELGAFLRPLLCQNPNSQTGPHMHRMKDPIGVTASSTLVSFWRGCERGSGSSIGVSRMAQASGRVAAGVLSGTEADRRIMARLFGQGKW